MRLKVQRLKFNFVGFGLVVIFIISSCTVRLKYDPEYDKHINLYSVQNENKEELFLLFLETGNAFRAKGVVRIERGRQRKRVLIVTEVGVNYLKESFSPVDCDQEIKISLEKAKEKYLNNEEALIDVGEDDDISCVLMFFYENGMKLSRDCETGYIIVY